MQRSRYFVEKNSCVCLGGLQDDEFKILYGNSVDSLGSLRTGHDLIRISNIMGKLN